MTVTTIPQVFQMEPDQVIIALKAKVKKIFTRKHGPSTHGEGEWSFQGLQLTDGTTEIKATLKNCVPFKEAKEGQWIYMLAAHGIKGHSGLYAVDETYDDKDGNPITARCIKITPSAEIRLASEMQSEPPAAAPPAAPAKPSAPRTAGKPVSPTGTHDGVYVARQFMGKAANAMLLALKGAAHTVKTFEAENPGAALTPEQFQAMTSSFFIALDKHAFISGLPTGPMDAKPAPEPKPDLGPAPDFAPDAADTSEGAEDNVPV